MRRDGCISIWSSVANRHEGDREPGRRWYWTERWRAIAKHQLDIAPVCPMCATQGRVTAPSICGHVDRHIPIL